jgi:hypothetical protein
MTDIHRWDMILGTLHDCGGLPVDTSRAFANPKPDDVRIVILERPSADTALVSWSSATNCRYGEQLWKKGISRRSGVCALSGDSIARGDSIFRPKRARNAVCRNATAMIRSGAMENEPLVEKLDHNG